jgi:hypothetical protein
MVVDYSRNGYIDPCLGPRLSPFVDESRLTPRPSRVFFFLLVRLLFCFFFIFCSLLSAGEPAETDTRRRRQPGASARATNANTPTHRHSACISLNYDQTHQRAHDNIELSVFDGISDSQLLSSLVTEEATMYTNINTNVGSFLYLFLRLDWLFKRTKETEWEKDEEGEGSDDDDDDE